MFDVEGLESLPKQGRGLTALHCEMYQQLKAAGVQLSTCLAIVPDELSVAYLKAYEVRKISGCVDFVFMMAYDMHGPSPDPNRTECSNSPLSSVEKGVDWYLGEDIPGSKLVLGLPW